MSALLTESTRGAASATQAQPPRAAPETGSEHEPWLRAVAARGGPVVLLAAILCAVTFLASGGLNLSSLTTVEIALTLGGGLAIAAAILLTPAGRPAHGLAASCLLLAFAALSALSVVWSVQPDASWQAASRLLAYSCVFALAALLARATPRRWSAVLGGIVLASVVVCGYALLTKVFPNLLGNEQVVYYARLREPYGYWNAIGLAAALGAIACLWLGARRAGHALVSALAYPAMAIMLVTLMLAYSRGALAALVLGLALWFCVVPLRLRGAAVLLLGGLGAGVVVAWDFSTAALTTDSATLAARVTAGHQLGVLLTGVLVALTLVGAAVSFASARRAPRPPLRRRAGIVLLCIPALAVLAVLAALALSHRGLTGSVSHGLSSLTNPNAAVPANGPGRLTAIGSARARYWHEALQVFAAHPALGAGAEGYATARLRYRTAPLKVQQAHGFLVQTLADLGIVGLVLVLALFAAWALAAGRATHPFDRRWSSWRWRRWPTAVAAGERALYTPERVGLLTMLCVVATFGVHSFVDWTWYVPGLACVALLCAGWLAGRGPLAQLTGPAWLPAGSRSAGALADVLAPADAGTSEPSSSAPPPSESAAPSAAARRWTVPGLAQPATGVALAVVAAALLAAWAEWQPQRSVDATNQALAQLARDPAGALAAARSAVARDPLSAEALITLAAVQQSTGQQAAAAATYQRAVRLQPSNWQTWEALGEYELHSGAARAALNALRAAVYLNPESVAPATTINQELLALQDDYLQALRETGAQRAAPAAGRPSGSRAGPSLRSARGARSPAARVALRELRRARTS
jgi:O-antigen ligase